MKKFHMLTFVLVLLVAINAGLVALFDLDILGKLGSSVVRWVYIAGGLSGVYEAVTHASRCKDCAKMPSMSGSM